MFLNGWMKHATFDGANMVAGIPVKRCPFYEMAMKTVEKQSRFCGLVFLTGFSRYNAGTDYYNALMRGAL